MDECEGKYKKPWMGWDEDTEVDEKKDRYEEEVNKRKVKREVKGR